MCALSEGPDTEEALGKDSCDVAFSYSLCVSLGKQIYLSEMQLFFVCEAVIMWSLFPRVFRRS